MSESKAIFPPKNQPVQDQVMTPPELARRCVQVLEMGGTYIDPCAGDGAFFEAVAAEGRCWHRTCCEIDPARKYFTGGDFLGDGTPIARFSWLVSNPPWSKYLSFAQRAFEVADNVAFLAPIERAFRLSVMRRAAIHGHGIKAIWTVPWPEQWSRSKRLGGAGVTKPDMAFGLTHWQRGYSGPIAFGELPELEAPND